MNQQTKIMGGSMDMVMPINFVLWNIGYMKIGVGKRTSRPTEARYV